MSLQEALRIASACHDASLAVGNRRGSCQIVCTAASQLLGERGIESSVLSVAAMVAHRAAARWIVENGVQCLTLENAPESFENNQVQLIGCPSAVRRAAGGVPDVGHDGSRLMHAALTVEGCLIDPTLDQAERMVPSGVHVFPLRSGLLKGYPCRFQVPGVRGVVVVYEYFENDPFFMPFPKGDAGVERVIAEARVRLG